MTPVGNIITDLKARNAQLEAELASCQAENAKLNKLAYLTIPIPKFLRRK